MFLTEIVIIMARKKKYTRKRKIRQSRRDREGKINEREKEGTFRFTMSVG